MKGEYVYYFYHHMMDYDQLTRIRDAIINHNWEAFQVAKGVYDSIEYKKMCPGFKEPEKVTYFPDHLFYYPVGSSESQILDLTKETFNKITDVDFECG